MNTKMGAAAIAIASLGLGFGAGSAMTRVARADVSAGPSASCGTSTPCLTESNTAGGAGVKSASARGNGLIATTKAPGSTSSNGRSALLGQDLQTTSGKGLFNFGVSGTSTNGTGVQGTGPVGISAVSTSATGVGVLASTTNASGLLFEGAGNEIGNGKPAFSVNAAGRAVFGQTGAGDGQVIVNQTCGSGIPLYEGNSGSTLTFQVTDCGLIYSTGQVQVPKLLVDQITTNTTGGEVNVFAPLVVTSAVDDSFESLSSNVGGTNYVAGDSSGVTWFYQGYSTAAGKYTVEMGDSGSVYARIFITMGESRVAQQSASGARFDTYAPQITQPSLEDFGEAQLSDGIANVPLDPKFAAVIDGNVRYYVTLTPEGDCRGLFVAQRTSTAFTVRELQGGRSSIAFTYRIVAKPLGDNSPRLPASILPYGFEHQVPSPFKRLSPPHVRGVRS
ncbi:MAG TPA: hypothetical protein VID24_13400 [Candidatus Eremiobacteraceae bacterium]